MKKKIVLLMTLLLMMPLVVGAKKLSYSQTGAVGGSTVGSGGVFRDVVVDGDKYVAVGYRKDTKGLISLISTFDFIDEKENSNLAPNPEYSKEYNGSAECIAFKAIDK